MNTTCSPTAYSMQPGMTINDKQPEHTLQASKAVEVSILEPSVRRRRHCRCRCRCRLPPLPRCLVLSFPFSPPLRHSSRLSRRAHRLQRQHARVVLRQVRRRPVDRQKSVWLSVADAPGDPRARRRYGGPSVLQMGELPDAELRGPSDVVVQVHAVALNPVRRSSLKREAVAWTPTME